MRENTAPPEASEHSEGSPHSEPIDPSLDPGQLAPGTPDPRIETPIELLPAEESPRLKSWKSINFADWRTLGITGHSDAGTVIIMLGAVASLEVCWQRLHDDYLRWFIPNGPLGTHAHVHYHKPSVRQHQADVLAAMSVDYESALGFLYTALNVTTRHISVALGWPADDWPTLVAACEQPCTWLPASLRAAVRTLQRGALYARSKGVVHPRPHYVITRWDNTGNVTHIRLPIVPASEEAVRELDAMWHRLQRVRDGVSVGKDLPGWQVVQFLDDSSGPHLDDADRKQLFKLREAIGYAYPTANRVGTAVNSLLEGFSDLMRPRSHAPEEGQ